MPVNLEDVDEVWLALDYTIQALEFESHSPVDNPSSCALCYSYTLLNRAKELLLQRGRVMPDASTT